jgi:putative endonuclease
MYFVYAIANEAGKIYIGQTADIVQRLKRHNGQLKTKSTSYTKINQGYWKLVYSEKCDTRISALKREKELKSYQGRQFLREKIENLGA